ncbi:signal recognition particle subunit SRP72 [Kwoniella heveanensis BCC8398]|uniref:Signal recognition particle subunit SRP72 n=1 Tax=Kwoniella heveanensis BCC8398 TaxID=1296120 RepID=A0A1B9GWL8_9TREE|nr:signal recognition particle subunit SRP72 [Kwoniella heveanensis BCC8398]
MPAKHQAEIAQGKPKAATAGAGSGKRKPFVPRAPRSPEERLPKLYRALTDQVDDGYFENAIKTCKKILALDPSSQAAFQTLLFLYLQTDDYTSALALLDTPPTGTTSSSGTLAFERAYCLYRLHREKEALRLLEEFAPSERDRKVQHLDAQIRYRLGEYQRAQQIYDDLLADCDSSSPEHPDILTNLSATSSHTDFSTHTYRSYLHSAPARALGADAGSSSSTAGAAVPVNEADLESTVPSLPTGWSTGGLAKTVERKNAAAAAAKASAGAQGGITKKPRHKLPKGAVVGKPFTEDPERWIPLRQRSTYIVAQNKKKGGKESMGTGFTQGSTASASANGSGGGNNNSNNSSGGGAKGKKGKRK